ncbi:MAG: hypothetical protein KGZ25_07940 [Planctomycetes bacterium]|nr:hypothetical protein [Planctomycetota bacterium]
MRILYGIQSTGKGHLSRFLGLRPHFREDGHKLCVIASGYETPPDYFLEAISDYEYHRFKGISYVGNGQGGVSETRTTAAFLKNFPRLMDEIAKAHRLVRDFQPDVIVSDFEPITACPVVAPDIPKIGLSHQSAVLSPGVHHPPGLPFAKLSTRTVVSIFTAGLNHKFGSHFYPANHYCLPPIIRPAILNAKRENRGHIIAYYTMPGLLPEIKNYALTHSDRQFIIYGAKGEKDSANIHYEQDRSQFAQDLASCDTYVGTAGFQSISEAFFLGKKIVVKPLAGQYEQIWNAAQLEHYGMGRWMRQSLVEALEQDFNSELHTKLKNWFENGSRTCYEKILAAAH